MNRQISRTSYLYLLHFPDMDSSDTTDSILENAVPDSEIEDNSEINLTEFSRILSFRFPSLSHYLLLT